MWNIIFGSIAIVGGLSGKLVLFFTNSSKALVAVGVALVIWGGIQLARGQRGDA